MFQRVLTLFQKRIVDPKLLTNLLGFGGVLAVNRVNVEIVNEIKEDSRHFRRRGKSVLQLRKEGLGMEVENDVQVSKKYMA